MVAVCRRSRCCPAGGRELLALEPGAQAADCDSNGPRAHQRQDLTPGQNTPDQAVVVIGIEGCDRVW